MSTDRKERNETGAPLTVSVLSGLKPGEWATGTGARGAGRLQAHRTAGGEVRFYYRFTGPDGKRERVPLGPWCRDGIRGMTLAQAYDRARALADRIRTGERDLRAALEAEELRHRRELEQEAARVAAELEAEAARKRAAEEAATAAESRSLGKLLTAYTASLEARGAVRWKEVANCLRLHVEKAFPDLWRREADALEVEDLLEPVARLVTANKRREAAKLRTYLRAAYSAAIRARTDATASATLRALRIRSNPAAPLSTVTGANKARTRFLEAPELAAYWRRVQALADPHRALLVAHLLLGAQRVEQLARATLADWNPRAGVVTLADPKGRREQARPHPVPVLPPVARAFNVMRKGAAAGHDFLWTLTAGKHGATYQAAADAVEQVAAAMLEAGEVSTRFTLGDLRRSVETLLQSYGVPVEVRAHLQSHGLSGVQAKHYAHFDFAAEKERALRLIWATVDPEAEAADRAERERLAALAAGGTVLQFRRPA